MAAAQAPARSRMRFARMGLYVRDPEGVVRWMWIAVLLLLLRQQGDGEEEEEEGGYDDFPTLVRVPEVSCYPPSCR